MWKKLENGELVENAEEILYSLNILDGFSNLAKNGFISEDAIFDYYSDIMNFEKAERVQEVQSFIKQMYLQNLVFDGIISKDLGNEIFDVMPKGRYIYKIYRDDDEIIACPRIKEKYEKKSTDDLLDEDTVKALYRFARNTDLGSYERYIFFMEMLRFDNKERVKEIEIAYNHIAIEGLVNNEFLSESEGKKLIEKIGQSKLYENWNNIITSAEEDEEEFEDENIAENSI